MQVMRFRKNSMLSAVIPLAVAWSIVAPAHAEFGWPDLGPTSQDHFGHSIQDGIRPSVLGMEESRYDPPISKHDGLGTDPNALRNAALVQFGGPVSGAIASPDLDLNVIYAASRVEGQRLDVIGLIPSGVTPDRGPLGASSPVPGPGALGLFGLAALMAARRRRRG